MKGTMGFVVWLVIMVAFMYFMVYRPQKKQENAAKVLRNSLTPGDTIETIGGFTGRIVSIKDEDVVFETGADKTKLVVKKWGIRSRTPADEK
ncbi:MAG: preprotein translocase subunit YajC [Clostridia bacterium]|nr:preprotein translocase subunit YajC [Clostridia bacterium]